MTPKVWQVVVVIGGIYLWIVGGFYLTTRVIFGAGEFRPGMAVVLTGVVVGVVTWYQSKRHGQ